MFGFHKFKSARMVLPHKMQDEERVINQNEWQRQEKRRQNLREERRVKSQQLFAESSKLLELLVYTKIVKFQQIAEK